MTKNQQSNNISLMVKWFCKLLVNKLPSISWKTNNDDKTTKNENKLNKSPVKTKSPIKKLTNQLNNNQLDNQLNHNQVNQLNNQSDQPDVVPMVHVLIPVRQRCHSTTTDC